MKEAQSVEKYGWDKKVLVDPDGDVPERRKKWFQGEFDNLAQSSLQEKEHWNGIHNMKLSLKGTSSLGTNLGKGEEKAQITLRNI